MRAVFNTDWHGVPAGTKVTVYSVSPDCQGTPIAKVEPELRGDLLPGPNGPQRIAYVASKFLTVIAY